MFLPSDLFFTHSDFLLARSIQWCCQSPGEPRTYANHQAGLVLGEKVLEALTTVVSTPLHDWILKHEDFVVARHRHLTELERAQIALTAMQYEGRKYGYGKIALHLFDSLISKVVRRDLCLFRKFIHEKEDPICNLVFNWAFEEHGYTFGKPAHLTDPDSTLDYIIDSSDWEIVFVHGKEFHRDVYR